MNNYDKTSNFVGAVQLISGLVDGVSNAEAVDSGLISGRVKPKTIKIGIHGFPA